MAHAIQQSAYERSDEVDAQRARSRTEIADNSSESRVSDLSGSAGRVSDTAYFKLRVERTLRGAARGRLSADHVAKSLAVSRRTMARRLLAEGNTFRDLSDNQAVSVFRPPCRYTYTVPLSGDRDMAVEGWCGGAGSIHCCRDRSVRS